jgi:hypothetical protein
MELVFETWKKNGKNVYEDCPELTLGSFHAGTIFKCEINLRLEDKEELNKALNDGFTPVFILIKDN